VRIKKLSCKFSLDSNILILIFKLSNGVQVHTIATDDITENERATYKQRAFELNNKAYQENNQGNYTEAERLHTEALNLKLIAMGPNSIGYALSANALAETQMKLGKWDEAEKNLLDAARIRDASNQKPFDAAVSRDLLGQVYEYRGDLVKARETRTKFPNRMACSFYEVRLRQPIILFTSSHISIRSSAQPPRV
jgi:tetratricopeptide (TPR) repeat protein